MATPISVTCQRIARPEEEAIEREEEKLPGEFKSGFEEKREELAHVFRAEWAGEKAVRVATGETSF